MESSPLIKAHDHARVASTATHTADTTVAINEHTSAAGEFANAAKNTNSVEALRTLKLLEQHHQRLSELLQLPFKRPAQNANNNDESGIQEKDDASATTTTGGGGGASSSQSAQSSNATNAEKGGQPMPTLARQPKYPSRDLGASIASNLASARGIRGKYRGGQPLSPSVSNTEAPGNVNVEAGSRKSGSRVKMQDMLDHSEKSSSSPVGSPEKTALTRQNSSSNTASQDNRDSPLASPTSTTAPSSSGDEGFSKFYSAFGTIINRISAPLAFAGLPLISEEQSSSSSSEQQPAPIPVPEPSQKRLRLKPSPSVAAEPDISKIYSKATLRAIARDGQSGTDSFYVVPTSGHTASYASILSYADKEKRRRSNRNEPGDHRGGKGLMIAEDADEDDFVDARESQQMPPHHSRSPPRLRKRGAAGGKGGGGHGPELSHVVEELYLENKSLKDALDKLSKRLHAFESMSQNSGMRLAESMRLMRPGSPPPPPLPPSSSTAAASSPSPAAASRTAAATAAAAGAGGDEHLVKRNRELEEQLMQASRQMTEMERDYTKARANLARYRERWEQLKAGAKARRTGGNSTQGGGTSETADEALATGASVGTGGMRSPSLA